MGKPNNKIAIGEVILLTMICAVVEQNVCRAAVEHAGS
jgi:hypothetical protein